NSGYTVNDEGQYTGNIFIPVSKLGFNEEGNNIYEYTNNVKIGGLSTITTNNVGINLDKRKVMLDNINKAILAGTMAPYGEILNTVSSINYIQNNSRNRFEDLNKGLGEGQANTEC